jgi:hypothetical protein
MKRPLLDERVIQETREQNSQAFKLLYYALFIDLIYRQYFLKEPISKDLLILFGGVTIFLAAKRARSGLLPDISQWRSLIAPSIGVTILVVGADYYFLNDHTSCFDLIIAGIISFIAFLGFEILTRYFSTRKNEKILEDD